MPALQADDVWKAYGSGETRVQAVAGVSISVDRGAMVALLGPSGSGKSTLIKVLGLVTAADRGRITLDDELVAEGGRLLGDLRNVRRTKLGFVFQRPNLIPFLTVKQNVEIAAEIAGGAAPSARARELLEYLDVGHRERALPNTLSGGEQQRVAIARALANRPTLILADEPTAALDSVRGRSVMELFRRVAKDTGAAVVVVTHDHRSLNLFDDLHEMEDGKLGPAPKSLPQEGSAPAHAV